MFPITQHCAGWNSQPFVGQRACAGCRSNGATVATINGSAGNDTINGSSAADTIYGGGGNDSINAGSGEDAVFTGSGADTINAGDGNDIVDSGGGNDVVFGGNGYDRLFGGDGDDKLYGGNDFFDDLYGGAGNDTIYSGNSNADLAYGGSGNDLIYSDQGDDTAYGDAGNDTLYGGDGADKLYGGDGDDSLHGGNGDDSIMGEAGKDTVYSGVGNDIAYGGTDNDSLFGEDGNDTLYGGDGNDTIYGGNDNDSILGDAGNDTLAGGSGNDTVYGDAGNDWINGGAGDDAVYGGTGNDTLSGQMGNDTLYGGDGADNFLITDDHEGDTIFGGEGGTDSDTLEFSNWISTQGVQVTFTGAEAGSYSYFGSNASGNFSQIETISSTQYNDSINATASTTAMNLYGGGGNDTITGGAGADVISGGSGNDLISGGAGNDVLIGGTGADMFQFVHSGGNDKIVDFNRDLVDGKTTDQLDVSDLRNLQGTSVKWRDVTVSDDGYGNALLTFPEGETVVLTGVTPAQATGKQNLGRMGIPCFTNGTKIRTPQGERAVETLRAGDIVMTADHGPQPLLWVGNRHVTRNEMLRKPQLFPIRLRGAPDSADLIVSRQHAVLITHQGQQVFVRAGHLADHGIKGARQCRGARSTSYYHLFLANHALLWSNGVLSESFYPGPMALQSLEPASCFALLLAFPALAGRFVGQVGSHAVYGPPARPVLARRDVMSAGWTGISQIAPPPRQSAILGRKPALCTQSERG